MAKKKTTKSPVKKKAVKKATTKVARKKTPAVSRDEKYEAHKRNMRERQREAVKDSQDVGEIPPCADPARREACRLDLLAVSVPCGPDQGVCSQREARVL